MTTPTPIKNCINDASKLNPIIEFSYQDPGTAVAGKLYNFDLKQ